MFKTFMKNGNNLIRNGEKKHLKIFFLANYILAAVLKSQLKLHSRVYSLEQLQKKKCVLMICVSLIFWKVKKAVSKSSPWDCPNVVNSNKQSFHSSCPWSLLSEAELSISPLWTSAIRFFVFSILSLRLKIHKWGLHLSINL